MQNRVKSERKIFIYALKANILSEFAKEKKNTKDSDNNEKLVLLKLGNIIVFYEAQLMESDTNFRL